MSSILKAIRKIEDDKRSRDNQAPNLMVDHGEASPRSKPVVLPSLVAGLLLGVFAVAVFLMLMRSDDDDKATRNQALVQESARVEPVLAASGDASSDRDEQNGNLPGMEPSKNVNNKIEVDNIQSNPVAPVEHAKTASIKQDISLEKLYAEKKARHVSSPGTSSSQSSLPKNIDLKVSEIFYQEDESIRMAVVNDLPVMVGTYVGDVMVQSINSDSVTFQSADKVFSITVATQ